MSNPSISIEALRNIAFDLSYDKGTLAKIDLGIGDADFQSFVFAMVDPNQDGKIESGAEAAEAAKLLAKMDYTDADPFALIYEVDDTSYSASFFPDDLKPGSITPAELYLHQIDGRDTAIDLSEKISATVETMDDNLETVKAGLNAQIDDFLTAQGVESIKDLPDAARHSPGFIELSETIELYRGIESRLDGLRTQELKMLNQVLASYERVGHAAEILHQDLKATRELKD